ncbi:serine hydrolase domain-containing protein [Roseiterribacter gracilis]|uniref:FmtA-like protein n=1 Tax=Roseiterribacter gracilis TaxID=2812848 RepID=A0A8S8XCB1_9PROT|nr:FmtA-like protein [Rhodospirillales bacterium TMPK1]
MSLRFAAALSALLFTQAAFAQVPAETTPAPPQPKLQAESPAQAAPTPARALTADDVAAYFDGLVPWSMARGGIAGAVVTVVKDGQVLFARGYGYSDVEKRTPVDPNTTMFRIGSTSKLFTWTAVMQLVEQGKIDLDKDVNTYLDFKIENKFGKPITLRQIMSHSAGFEEGLRYILVPDAKNLQSLGDFLKTNIPGVVYPPGDIIAYSNYSTALAGYVVERVSGKPFDDYIEQNIYAPLGMKVSSFRQPLPEALQPHMSKGYRVASQPPKPFENVGPFPAGSMSSSGADMAKFMIAHLAGGAPLQVKSARMFEISKEPVPGITGFGLGFYHEDRNGHVVVGHGGDLELFHTNLSLLPGDNVGVFVSFNSAGNAGITGALRTAILRGFVDRYYPGPALPNEPTLATAKEHGQKVSGEWRASRGGTTSFLRISGLLSHAKTYLNPDDTLSFSGFTDAANAPKKWREVQPFVWREVNGPALLKFQMDAAGKPILMATSDMAPVMVFMAADAANSTTMALLVGAAAVILLVTFLSWPVNALVRRHYGRTLPFEGRDRVFYRVSRAVSGLLVALVAYWLYLLSKLGTSIASISYGLEGTLLFLRVLGVVALVGAVFLVFRAALTFRDPRFGLWGKIANVLIALAGLVMIWCYVTYNLVSFGSHY